MKSINEHPAHRVYGILGRLIEGASADDIRREFNVTEQRVHNIHKSALKEARKAYRKRAYEQMHREREVVLFRMREDEKRTLREIGEYLGVSAERVRQMYYRACRERFDPGHPDYGHRHKAAWAAPKRHPTTNTD